MCKSDGNEDEETRKYRIERSDFNIVVDASWNEDWNGTEQRRHFGVARALLKKKGPQ